MIDPYINNYNVVDRLLTEFYKHGKLIIGVDFDNTIFDFHGEGHYYDGVVQLLKESQALGFPLCLYTGNDDKAMIDLMAKGYGIKFDYINESPIKSVSKPWKPYFSILLDDRAGLPSAYEALKTVLMIIKKVK